jgi:hypothetical protein
MTDLPGFERELEALINRFSGEQESGTPDFILARFLVSCLITWNASVERRELWYGRQLQLNSAVGDLAVPPSGNDPQ